MMDLLMPQRSGEAEREADGFIQGLAVAEVTNNEDPKGLGRCRVRFSWQVKPQESYWARLAVPMAMGNRGSFWLPEVHDEVLVGFEKGDLTHPCIIGSLWNGKNLPPENNDDKKNDHRLFRSRANSELRFFDGDKPFVELNLADGKRLLMNDKGITIEDGSGNSITIESSSGGLKIKSSNQIQLESKNISIKAGANLELKSSGTLTINGTIININ